MNRDPDLRALSLGAGKQSTAVFLLMCEDRIPRADVALFADTGWEPRAVYDHLAVLERIGREHDLPVETVSVGNIRKDALDPDHRFASMPLYMTNPDGTEGMARRQCSKEYKIEPVNRRLREIAAERLGIEAPTWNQVPRDYLVEVVFGISVDEVQRMTNPKLVRFRNAYPLTDTLVWSEGSGEDKVTRSAAYGTGMRWTRARCVRYCNDVWSIDPPRSACVGCPYRTNHEWRDMRENRPDEWADAVAFDEAVRDRDGIGTFDGTMFVHRARQPLPLVDLATSEDDGQLTLLDAECEGVCGV